MGQVGGVCWGISLLTLSGNILRFFYPMTVPLIHHLQEPIIPQAFRTHALVQVPEVNHESERTVRRKQGDKQNRPFANYLLQMLEK